QMETAVLEAVRDLNLTLGDRDAHPDVRLDLLAEAGVHDFLPEELLQARSSAGPGLPADKIFEELVEILLGIADFHRSGRGDLNQVGPLGDEGFQGFQRLDVLPLEFQALLDAPFEGVDPDPVMAFVAEEMADARVV